MKVSLLAAARLVINTSARFVYPFLPAISRGLGISLGQAGLLVAARWTAGLATPAVVAAAGRSERRRGLLLAGLALFAVGAAVTAATDLFIGALVGFVLLGVAKPVYDVAAQAYVSDQVPYRRRARLLAALELTWATSLLVGAPAAGWLIARAGWNAPFWVLAALGLAALLAVSWVVEVEPPAARGPVARLRLDRAAVALLAAVALFTLASEVALVVFGAWLEDGFGLSLLALGGAGTLLAVAELAGEGSVLAFADRWGKRRSVAIGLLVSASGFALLAATHRSLAAGLAAFALAFAGVEFTIVSSIPLASEVRPAARTRYLALLVVAMGAARAVGAALGPAVLRWRGPGGIALLAAAIDLVALAVLLRWAEEGAAPVAADQTSSG